MTPNSLWTQIQEYLKETMPLNTFTVYVASAKAIKVDNKTLVIRADSLYCKHWAESHLSATIEQYLKGIVGVDMVEFVDGN